MNKKRYFLKIFRLAQKKYGKSTKRLAGDAWPEHWQTIVTTILSAQSRDEVTILIAEALFKKYPTLHSLAAAKFSDAKKILKSINYNNTKTKHVIQSAKFLIRKCHSKVPETIEELIQMPGVGRKTANLVITECHKKPGITVDTHVHRISNALGLVKTKTPHQTEFALMKIAPKKYWSRINRLFVLWGKEVRGRNREKLLSHLNQQ